MLEVVPEPRRDLVAALLHEAFPHGGVEALEPGPSGASGATTFRVHAGAGDHFLRVEGALVPGRNPHQYANLLAAAEAGIAPPVRAVDEEHGLLLVPWIEPQPLASHPRLLVEVARLVARLQALEPFPADEQGAWVDRLHGLLHHVVASGVVAPGLLDEVADGFERLRAVWPGGPSASVVAAHNDPNTSNLLFDGRRLWLVDWETSSPNDPLVDLAVVANELAPTPDLIDVLLTAWRGRGEGDAPPLDDGLRARLALAQFATRLFAGCMIALITVQLGAPPLADLDGPTPSELERLPRGAPDTMVAFAKVVLGGLRDTSLDPSFARTLEVAAQSPSTRD